MNWQTENDGAVYRAKTASYEVELTRLSPEQCRAAGYPQCAEGWSMRFVRGCLRSYAFHESLSAAKCNAERIVNYCAGTHDMFGYPKRRHVSGSLLPSNEPRILRPVETPFGTLQVRVIAELDTHGLFHRDARGESLLATHGNGYSCFNLLEHMAAGRAEAARKQAQYLLDCGGTVSNVDHMIALIPLEYLVDTPAK